MCLMLVTIALFSFVDVALFNFITAECDICGLLRFCPPLIVYSGTLHNTTVGPEFWKTMNLLPEGTKIIFNLVGFLTFKSPEFKIGTSAGTAGTGTKAARKL